MAAYAGVDIGATNIRAVIGDESELGQEDVMHIGDSLGRAFVVGLEDGGRMVRFKRA